MSWEKVKLADMIEKPISGEWGEEGDSVYVIRTTNFSNEGDLDLTDVVKRNIAPDKVLKKKLIYGDSILEKSGGSPNQPVGRVVFFDIRNKNGSEYLCNNFTSILRPKATVHPKYLFWFLFYNHISKKTLRYQNKTTGIINLKTERYLNDLLIPCPSFPLQQKIATILDHADVLRKKDLQLLDKYDELLQAVFYDMFGDPVKNEKGWEIVLLDDLIIDGPQNGLYKSSKDYGDGTPILRIDSFYDGIVYNIESLKRVHVSDKELKLFQIYEDNIVINRVNSRSHLGKCALIPKLMEPTLFESNMMRFEIDKNKVNPKFLVQILVQPFMKTQILGRAKDAVNQSSINQQDVKSFYSPLPPIELQNQFASLGLNIQKQKDQTKKQLQKSEELFQGLLHQAFKGELVKE